MSDELLNNEEETSALFVSAQKKKKAEEEAAQRAADEQARREAAEAEVRRMEAEVEERKRKAEEDKKALEEEEKRLAEEKKNTAKGEAPDPQPVQQAKQAVEKASAGMAAGIASKRPIIIGAVAAAAVVVILILVFALRGGGKKSIDPATMEFNAEYVSKEAGFDLKFVYPDSIYAGVTEEKGDSALTIHFGDRKRIDVVVNPYELTNSTDVVTRRYAAALIPADDMISKLKETGSANLKQLIPDGKVTEESSTDIKADDAGKYFYQYTFESAEAGIGAASSWFDSDSAGNCKIVTAIVKSAATAEEAAAIRDAFVAKNSENALGVPGYKPPTGTDTDGLLEVDEIHMGLLVPKDEFVKYTQGDLEYYLFSDDNGATILVDPIDVGGEIAETMSVEGVEELFKKWVDRGINSYYKACDSRMVLDEKFVAEETGMHYIANCKDIIGGVTYWERYIAAYWFDVRQQKDFYYIMITMAPERNKENYQPIFDKMFDRLQDL